MRATQRPLPCSPGGSPASLPIRASSGICAPVAPCPSSPREEVRCAGASHRFECEHDTPGQAAVFQGVAGAIDSRPAGRAPGVGAPSTGRCLCRRRWPDHDRPRCPMPDAGSRDGWSMPIVAGRGENALVPKSPAVRGCVVRCWSRKLPASPHMAEFRAAAADRAWSDLARHRRRNTAKGRSAPWVLGIRRLPAVTYGGV